MRKRLAVVALLVLFGACAGNNGKSDVNATGTTLAHGTATTSADPNTTTLVDGKPHFGSPEAAMRYLADAWNRNDLVALKHVTNPAARDQLNNMHGVAINLRLNHCEARQGQGDYQCFFDHDYPPHASTTLPSQAMVDTGAPAGQAVFLVGPATTPGWYMTVFESCS